MKNRSISAVYRTLFPLVTWFVLSCAMIRAAEQSLVVQLPPGETLIQEIAMYRVGWQSYGKDSVLMPPSWAGHFDPDTGISFQPWGRVLGRDSLLMHSPWHVPPGRTWVDYELALPAGQSIRLEFGIAMGPDVAAPDKSDGVTFSCSLRADGQDRELMRKHHNRAEWLDYRFDLTPWAGKTVVLKLQVEPGPRNDSSFDYSFFGDAKIVVGDAKQDRVALLKSWLDSRAYKATASASRESASNSGSVGVAGSNILPFKNQLEKKADDWLFQYTADDCQVLYTYRPSTGTLSDFTVQIDDQSPFQPAMNGCATATFTKDNKTESVTLQNGHAVEITRSGDLINAVWEYDAKGRKVRLKWTFGMRGKSLLVAAQCDEPVISELTLGEVGLVPVRRIVPIPYLNGSVAYLPMQRIYVSRYLDWTKSHSSQCPQGKAIYEPKTDGTRNPMFEVGMIAVSPEISEVLPNIPNPPSPFLDVLGPRIMLDIWGHQNNTYAGDAENLRQLKDLGVDNVVIIQHVWQRYGYDAKLPDHLPADPSYGGDEGMKVFGKAANECGFIWSLHENYIDLYPDAPSYDPAARVLRPDGTPSPAWYNAGTRVQSYGLKCNRALGFAKQNSPEAHSRYGTTAAYLDVHTCVPPWHQLDHEANQPMAAMAKAKVQYDTELFQFERDSHKGPLFGEGANHFYWAGRCDGVEAQVAGGEDHAPLLDFDLLKIHPQMVNHGMGYYERWFRGGYDHRLGEETGTVEQIDKYRAMEIAYAHAGFVGSPQDHNWHWVVREHHLMHPVQRLYNAAKPVEIVYEVDGQFVTASVAVAMGNTWRQRIRYANGLTVWVNWSSEPWTVEKRSLPQWGFLALGPKTDVSTSLHDGKIADYVDCSEYIFADARTSFFMPYRHGPVAIEPRLREFQYLGGNRIRVTYEWVVDEPVDKDYICFVHGVNQQQAETPDHIAFQQDHNLPKPTSQWRKGDVIVDGPYEVTIGEKFDSYDLTIGLHQGGRINLKGLRDASNRVIIARLAVKKEAGKITGVSAAKPTEAEIAASAKGADFQAHLNPTGTFVEFGTLGTDGSVKINKEADRLVLFPYPRDCEFKIALDLDQLAPASKGKTPEAKALAAGDQHDLGAVAMQRDGNRYVLRCGLKGAGRYVITWK